MLPLVAASQFGIDAKQMGFLMASLVSAHEALVR
jgi:hypothetical protein